MDTRKMLFLLPPQLLFNHLKYSEFVRIGTRESIFLTAAFDVLPGIREGLLDPHFPPQSSSERKHIYFKRLTQNNDIVST